MLKIFNMREGVKKPIKIMPQKISVKFSNSRLELEDQDSSVSQNPKPHKIKDKVVHEAFENFI